MNFLEIGDFSETQVLRVFARAGSIESEPSLLRDRNVWMLFPESSIRTRTTFELGIAQLGGRGVLFPPEVLERKEDFRDLVAYLESWIHLAVIRHPSFELVKRFADLAPFPVVNAMTRRNHPCEILSDLYAFSRLRPDWRTARYLFVGAAGNICDTWLEAANLLGFPVTQACLPQYRSSVTGPTLDFTEDLEQAIRTADIVLTDGLVPELRNEEYLSRYRITASLMSKARPGALCNPCPPFTRGGEVSEDLVESACFVGHGFKASLLAVQQAIMLECLEG